MSASLGAIPRTEAMLSRLQRRRSEWGEYCWSAYTEEHKGLRKGKAAAKHCGNGCKKSSWYRRRNKEQLCRVGWDSPFIKAKGNDCNLTLPQKGEGKLSLNGEDRTSQCLHRPRYHSGRQEARRRLLVPARAPPLRPAATHPTARPRRRRPPAGGAAAPAAQPRGAPPPAAPTARARRTPSCGRGTAATRAPGTAPGAAAPPPPPPPAPGPAERPAPAAWPLATTARPRGAAAGRAGGRVERRAPSGGGAPWWRSSSATLRQRWRRRGVRGPTMGLWRALAARPDALSGNGCGDPRQCTAFWGASSRVSLAAGTRLSGEHWR